MGKKEVVVQCPVFSSNINLSKEVLESLSRAEVSDQKCRRVISNRVTELAEKLLDEIFMPMILEDRRTNKDCNTCKYHKQAQEIPPICRGCLNAAYEPDRDRPVEYLPFWHPMKKETNDE